MPKASHYNAHALHFLRIIFVKKIPNLCWRVINSWADFAVCTIRNVSTLLYPKVCFNVSYKKRASKIIPRDNVLQELSTSLVESSCSAQYQGKLSKIFDKIQILDSKKNLAQIINTFFCKIQTTCIMNWNGKRSFGN